MADLTKEVCMEDCVEDWMD